MLFEDANFVPTKIKKGPNHRASAGLMTGMAHDSHQTDSWPIIEISVNGFYFRQKELSIGKSNLLKNLLSLFFKMYSFMINEHCKRLK